MSFPAIERFEDWSPEEIPTGFVAEAGTSRQYITGSWRSMRPVWIEENCTSCMMCWIACPDSSVFVRDGKMCGFDYEHCKGCGVCVHECRFDAIQYIREDEVVAEEERELAAALDPKEA